jgi:hypothetical protein
MVMITIAAAASSVGGAAPAGERTMVYMSWCPQEIDDFGDQSTAKITLRRPAGLVTLLALVSLVSVPVKPASPSPRFAQTATVIFGASGFCR